MQHLKLGKVKFRIPKIGCWMSWTRYYLQFDEIFQVPSTIKNSTYKPIVNLSSNHLVTIQFTWPIQTPLSTGIWLNKLFSKQQLQYHHARFVCILPRLPKWQSVAMFSAGLVFSTIWHFLTIPGANVSCWHYYILKQITLLNSSLISKLTNIIFEGATYG